MPKAAQVVSSPAADTQFFQLLSLLLGCGSEGRLLRLQLCEQSPKLKGPPCLQRHMPKTGDVFPRPLLVRPRSVPKPCCPWKTWLSAGEAGERRLVMGH